MGERNCCTDTNCPVWGDDELEAVCLWCGEQVADEGDTCNLVCYENIFRAVNLAVYLQEDDTPPKDLYLQPWAIEGLTNDANST